MNNCVTIFCRRKSFLGVVFCIISLQFFFKFTTHWYFQKSFIFDKTCFSLEIFLVKKGKYFVCLHLQNNKTCCIFKTKKQCIKCNAVYEYLYSRLIFYFILNSVFWYRIKINWMWEIVSFFPQCFAFPIDKMVGVALEQWRGVWLTIQRSIKKMQNDFSWKVYH